MADPTQPGYEVGAMYKRPEPDEQGNIHDVWTVHYATDSGVHSHVKIPATHLNATNVHSLITHEHKHIRAVQNLGTNPPPPEGVVTP